MDNLGELGDSEEVEVMDPPGEPEETVASNSNTSKRTSSAHDHFKNLDGEKKYQCNYCKLKLNEVKGGSTSNLLRHLKRVHPTVLQAGSKDQKPNILNFLTSKEGFSQAEFEKFLVDFVILTNQPFSIVEEESFRKLILLCNPKAVFVSADTMKRRILARYEEEQKRLSNTLQQIRSKISFVLDCWTSSTQTAFQGIIGRWIDEDWVYQETIIDLDILDGKHTGEMLCSSFTGVLEKYNIVDKIMGITTDNASNCDTFFAHLSEYLSAKEVDFDAENQRIRCLAHIINLACQDAISILKQASSSIAIQESSQNDDEMSTDSESENSGDEIQEATVNNRSSIFQKLRKGIIKIRKSTQRRETFKKQCEVSQIKHNELVKDVSTRWNSTYFMLKRAFKMKIPFENTLRTEKVLKKLTLSDEEWKLVEGIVTFLKPFKQLSIALSCGNAPISASVMVYMQLYNHLETITEENGFSSLVVEASIKACNKLNKYYPTSDGLIHVIGTILDPRCKFTWYTCNSTHFPSSLLKKYRTAIKKYWETNYKPKSGIDKPEDVTVKSIQKPEDLFYLQMKRAKLDKRDELQVYLEEPVVCTDDIKDGILMWWKSREHTFPNLAKMARDYLSASGTGVPIERLFSRGTDLLSSKRQSMHGETVRKCMCLQGWIRSRNKDDFRKFVSDSLVDRVLGNIS